MSAEPSSPHAMQVVQRFLDRNPEHAIIVLGTDGVVIGWLGASERLLGWTAREACGQVLDFIFTREDRALHMPQYELAVALVSGASEDDRWHLRRDGSAIWVTGSLNAVRGDGGELLGFVKLFRDRTDLRAHLGSLSHRMDQLARDHARNLQGMARLGHEVRNPLGVISNGLDILRRRPPNGGWNEQELLSMMERQVQAITRLSDDLMEVVRGHTGKLELQRQRLDLAEAVRQAVESVRPRYDAKPVSIELVVPPDTPLPLEADPVRLQQIMGNLLDNALKFTPPRGRVVVKATIEADMALVRVKDNGIGITAGMLPLVFGLFAQEERDVDLGRRGIGLGLALVKELAEAHGGNAEARSPGAGKGSEFSVRLPLRAPPAADDLRA